MSLPIREQAKYWGIALAVFFVALWALGGVILPFLVGGAVAYFLDPVADRLERAGLSRVAATSVITAAAMLIFVALVLAVIPSLVNQLTALINAAPDIAQRLREWQRIYDQWRAQYEVLQALTKCGSEAPIALAMDRMWDAYTDCLGREVGDENNWLGWYCWENDMGAKGLEVTSTSGKTIRVKIGRAHV